MNSRIYCISDIHNDADSFKQMLSLINFKAEDMLYIVGDVFDRGPKPKELYEEIRKYSNIVCLKGNHDDWLAKYIFERHQRGIKMPYFYNTYVELLKSMNEKELLELTEWIEAMPLYVNVEVDGRQFQLVHAQASSQPEKESKGFFLMDGEGYYDFLRNGIEGVISVVGHYPTMRILKEFSLAVPTKAQIWINDPGNVYVIDCGNGYRKRGEGGRLGCLCLNDYREYYV
ncbi:MAG: fructose-bisphosphatase class III [Lachnospira sp.]|nr:fructose-bisphosphatase class III [Lachnospira sp.]